MAGAGFLLVLFGIAGRLAPALLPLEPLGPSTTGAIIAGSWAAVGLGVLLILIVMAREDLGYGGFLVAGGVGALIAQLETGWLDRQASSLLIGIGLALVIAVGVGLVVLSLSEMDDESVGAGLLLFAVASLVTDIIFDFGEGWDELMNVSTVLLTSAFVAACVILATDAVGFLEGPNRRRYLAAAKPGWGHPYVTFFLYWGARVVTASIGVTAVIIAVIASFEPPTFVNVLLTLPAVLGVYLVAPVLAYVWVVRAVGPERYARGGLDIFDAVDEQTWIRTSAAVAAGYVSVALLVELIVFGPAVWLAILLVLAAVAAGVVAARFAVLGFPAMVASLIASSNAPERTAPEIADILAELGRSDPVFRLLPGSDILRY